MLKVRCLRDLFNVTYLTSEQQSRTPIESRNTAVALLGQEGLFYPWLTQGPVSPLYAGS